MKTIPIKFRHSSELFTIQAIKKFFELKKKKKSRITLFYYSEQIFINWGWGVLCEFDQFSKDVSL